ncbi:riboflavin synthase [Pseudarthrobacter sp. J1763]|uniref:riboflavin synthase n=1 Tax=Pseudarthrobacter sp. J1763 TaxID=3420445 RepID=UPI003D2BCD39
MFTGIIAEQGTVVGLEREGDSSARLRLSAPTLAADLGLGGSIAVNGVCLTAVENNGTEFFVDVMGETLRRSTIGSLEMGQKVNLERCVQAGDRLDGHVVQGHVDGVGALLERESQGPWDRLRFSVPQNLARYIAEKGSIAIDGVSLTVTAVSEATSTEPWFEVGLIPITLAETGLGAKTIGGEVNLEVDVLAKYTERLLSFGPATTPAANGTTAANSATAAHQ